MRRNSCCSNGGGQHRGSYGIIVTAAASSSSEIKHLDWDAFDEAVFLEMIEPFAHSQQLIDIDEQQQFAWRGQGVVPIRSAVATWGKGATKGHSRRWTHAFKRLKEVLPADAMALAISTLQSFFLRCG